MTLWRGGKTGLAGDVFRYLNADVVVCITVGELRLRSSIRGQYWGRERWLNSLCPNFVCRSFSFSSSQSLESYVLY
jgi:hypothetical protein